MWILTNTLLEYIFLLHHTRKISRKPNINSHIINQMFKFQVFVILIMHKKYVYVSFMYKE